MSATLYRILRPFILMTGLIFWVAVTLSAIVGPIREISRGTAILVCSCGFLCWTVAWVQEGTIRFKNRLLAAVPAPPGPQAYYQVARDENSEAVIITGDDGFVVNLILSMGNFILGQSLPGFVAFLEQQGAARGIPQQVNPRIVEEHISAIVMGLCEATGPTE